MANNRCTYQQTYNVSIPKNDLKNMIILDEDLSKKDLRVCLYLFTILDGWKEPKRSSGRREDPCNFKIIYPDVIGDELGLSRKEVTKSIRTLIRHDIVEEGDANGVEDGLRFCF